MKPPPRRPGLPLKDRLAVVDGVPAGAASRQHHCWVTRGGRACEGLMVTWRQGPAGWEGWTVYVVVDRGSGAVRLVQEWVSAADLSPARTETS